MAASCTLRMKRLVTMWIAAAAVLLVSIGATVLSQVSTCRSAENNPVPPFVWPEFPAGASWGREIRNELNRQSPWPLDIQEHSLVTARNGDDAAEAKFVEYLGALYAQRPPDLIVALVGLRLASSSNTGQTCIRQRRCCSRQSKYAGLNPPCCPSKTLWLQCAFDQVALVENILRLLPETKTIAMILGNSPGERFWAGEQKRILGPLLGNKVELIFYNERPFEEILKEVASLPPHSCNLLSADGGGRRRCRLWRQGAIEAHL